MHGNAYQGFTRSGAGLVATVMRAPHDTVHGFKGWRGARMATRTRASPGPVQGS
jgi:hypothetical protein